MTPEEMAKVLAKKLTKAELIDLFTILDEEDGLLFDAVGEQVAAVAPEIFEG
jgi:hypothetical protein